MADPVIDGVQNMNVQVEKSPQNTDHIDEGITMSSPPSNGHVNGTFDAPESISGSLLNFDPVPGLDQGQMMTSPFDQSDLMKAEGGFDPLSSDLFSMPAQTDSGLQSPPSSATDTKGESLLDFDIPQNKPDASTASVSPQSPQHDNFGVFDPLEPALENKELTPPDLMASANPMSSSPVATDLLQMNKPSESLSSSMMEELGIYDATVGDQIVPGSINTPQLEEIGVYGAPPPPPPEEPMEVEPSPPPKPDLIPGFGSIAPNNSAANLLDDMGVMGAPPPAPPQEEKKGAVDSKQVMAELEALSNPAPMVDVPASDQPANFAKVSQEPAPPPSQPMEAFGIFDSAPDAPVNVKPAPPTANNDMSLFDMEVPSGATNGAQTTAPPVNHPNPAHPFAQPFSDLLMSDERKTDEPVAENVPKPSHPAVVEEPAPAVNGVAPAVPDPAPQPAVVPPLDLTQVKQEPPAETSPKKPGSSPVKMSASSPRSPSKKTASTTKPATPKSPKSNTTTPRSPTKPKSPTAPKSPNNKSATKPNTTHTERPKSATSSSAASKIPSPKKERPASASPRKPQVKAASPRKPTEKKSPSEETNKAPTPRTTPRSATPKTTPRMTPRKDGASDSGIEDDKSSAKRPSSSAGKSPRPTTPRTAAAKKDGAASPRTTPANKVTPTSSGKGPIVSKVGSMQNAKHKPGGGQVKIVSQKKDYSNVQSKCGSTDNIKHTPRGGAKKIESRKLDWKVESRVGSLDNAKHTPKGGEKKIESQKLNWNVQSKVGSLDNAKHKPTGGEKKIQSQKLNWSVQSKVGSLDNAQHKAGGGEKKIEDRKLDWKVESKVGSLENATHKPAGGDKKIETRKLDFKEKAAPKVGSKDNIKHQAGGGEKKIETHKLDFKERAQVRTDAGRSPRMSESSSVTSQGSGTADMSSVQEPEVPTEAPPTEA